MSDDDRMTKEKRTEHRQALKTLNKSVLSTEQPTQDANGRLIKGLAWTLDKFHEEFAAEQGISLEAPTALALRLLDECDALERERDTARAALRRSVEAGSRACALLDRLLNTSLVEKFRSVCAPYGYRLRDDGRGLVEHDDEQAVIAAVRAYRAAGLSRDEVAAHTWSRRLMMSDDDHTTWEHRAAHWQDRAERAEARVAELERERDEALCLVDNYRDDTSQLHKMERAYDRILRDLKRAKERLAEMERERDEWKERATARKQGPNGEDWGATLELLARRTRERDALQAEIDAVCPPECGETLQSLYDHLTWTLDDMSSNLGAMKDDE